MIRRIPLPGANYGFALPDGTIGCNHGGAIEASRIGRVEWPGEGILRLDGVRWRGRLYMAGEGNQSGHAWLWSEGGTWRDFGPTYGVGTCAFGDGYLFIAVPGNAYKRVNLDTFEETLHAFTTGSQGLRYVDGNLPVTGDATIGFNPAEFTIRNGVIAGQGHEGGTLVNGHIIEPGEAYFVKLKNDGDNFALYVVKFAENQGVAFFFTKAEIDALIDAPPPPPPPPPPKKDPPVSINHLDTLQRVRAKYPEKIDASQAVAILNETAWEHRDEGLGLLRKDGGNHGPQPTTGILCSCDWIVNSKTGNGGDCLVSGPDSTIGELNVATPTWNDSEAFDQSRFVKPVAPGGVGPGPNPPPSGSSFASAASALEATIANLARTVQEQGKLIAALAARPVGGNVTGITDGATIAFKSHDNGQYLTVEPEGDVNARGPRDFGDYQLFTIEVH